MLEPAPVGHSSDAVPGTWGVLSTDVAAAGSRRRGKHAAVLGIRTSGCAGQLDAGTPTAFSLRSTAFVFWARATGCTLPLPARSYQLLMGKSTA